MQAIESRHLAIERVSLLTSTRMAAGGSGRNRSLTERHVDLIGHCFVRSNPNQDSSISPSTANCAAAILSRSASMMLSTALAWPHRAIVMQKKTPRPVQFEITEQTRDAVVWIAAAHLKPE